MPTAFVINERVPSLRFDFLERSAVAAALAQGVVETQRTHAG